MMLSKLSSDSNIFPPQPWHPKLNALSQLVAEQDRDLNIDQENEENHKTDIELATVKLVLSQVLSKDNIIADF